ncbi:uncharacterized protein DS421_14g469380 [Arachis hypogaea]|nr:uncharacterized protein DS421_14g469380 [Arachis hypogaea]
MDTTAELQKRTPQIEITTRLEVAVHPFTLVGVAVPVHWSCCAFSICRQLAISAGEDIISGRRGGGADSDSGDTDYQSLRKKKKRNDVFRGGEVGAADAGASN